MTWFRVDDGWHSHPKVLELSLAAAGLWAKGGSWCAFHLTDGRITKAAVRSLGGTEKLALELVGARLWSVADGGWQYHEWEQRQPSRAAIEKEREQKRLRQRRWRENDGAVDGDVDASTDATHNPSQDTPVTPAPARAFSRPLPAPPVPSQPKQQEGDGDCGGGPALPRQPAPPPAPIVLGEPRKRRPKAPPKDPLRAQIVTSATWVAYNEAYFARYRVQPTRNAKVNGQIAHFVQRVPHAEAPAIAAHYVRSNNARYVAAGHAWGALLQDAEKLRTEWQNGTSGTAHAARQADRQAGRSGEYAEMVARLEAEDRQAIGGVS